MIITILYIFPKISKDYSFSFLLFTASTFVINLLIFIDLLPHRADLLRAVNAILVHSP